MRSIKVFAAGRTAPPPEPPEPSPRERRTAEDEVRGPPMTPVDAGRR